MPKKLLLWPCCYSLLCVANYWHNVVPHLEVVLKNIKRDACKRIRSKVDHRWAGHELSWLGNFESSCII